MVIWIIVAIVAAILEVLTTGLFLAMVAVAAAITAVIAPFLPWVVDILIFSALSLFGILAVRPFVANTLGLDSLMRHDQPVMRSHITGRRAVVTQTVDAGGGQIRIGQGEFWSARSYDPAQTFLVGQTVEVMTVDGLTALVAPPLAAEPDLPQLPSSTAVTSDKGE